MHELSIASGLVEKLLDFSDKNPDKKIIEVRLAVGELSHIEHEQLRFCYEAITAETPLEGSALEIEKIDAMVKCPQCSYRGRPKYWDGALSGIPVATLECPSCGKATEATDGQECAIRSVRFMETNPIAS
ncbi:MAG TPA: hydrogenase maturation nickel metallochaperone HypA [Chthoniobacterales bacterium]|nr:hydrogenase maturation nickel metallochaperone HypA [Chthoniobacterales bacterium]